MLHWMEQAVSDISLISWPLCGNDSILSVMLSLLIKDRPCINTFLDYI
jgi:hypothetical protein